MIAYNVRTTIEEAEKRGIEITEIVVSPNDYASLMLADIAVHRYNDASSAEMVLTVRNCIILKRMCKGCCKHG